MRRPTVLFFTVFLPVSFDRYIIGTYFFLVFLSEGWEIIITWYVYIIGQYLSSSRLIQLSYCKHASFYLWVVYIVKQTESILSVMLGNSTKLATLIYCHPSQCKLSRRYQIVALAN